jgi:hypothetical protein
VNDPEEPTGLQTPRLSIFVAEERVMVRIPTHGPPTHPGTMLLEEFLEDIPRL